MYLEIGQFSLLNFVPGIIIIIIIIIIEKVTKYHMPTQIVVYLDISQIFIKFGLNIDQNFRLGVHMQNIGVSSLSTTLG